MQSNQITVGTRYAWNQYGSKSGRYAPRLGHENLTQVTVTSAPVGGTVSVKTHEGRGTPSRTYDKVNVRDLLGTWAEQVDLLDAKKAREDEALAEQRALDVRLRALLGDAYADSGVGFDGVEGDGSYSTKAGYGAMQRSTLVALLEAARERGYEDGAADQRDRG